MAQDDAELFVRYTETTHYGRSLLEVHSLDEFGFWEILGEDPNADFHGAHHQPQLGIVQGKLRDVIEYGIRLPHFWTWGGGGNFRHIGSSVPLITAESVGLRKALEARAAKLAAELKEVNKLLGNP